MFFRHDKDRRRREKSLRAVMLPKSCVRLPAEGLLFLEHAFSPGNAARIMNHELNDRIAKAGLLPSLERAPFFCLS